MFYGSNEQGGRLTEKPSSSWIIAPTRKHHKNDAVCVTVWQAWLIALQERSMYRTREDCIDNSLVREIPITDDAGEAWSCGRDAAARGACERCVFALSGSAQAKALNDSTEGRWSSGVKGHACAKWTKWSRSRRIIHACVSRVALRSRGNRIVASCDDFDRDAHSDVNNSLITRSNGRK